ncbi:MAG: PepSY-associated TM helix domain-containing protein [Bryobacteraceae bacterium]
MRRWLQRLHLYFGLILTVYAVLLGVSGALLVFEKELADLSRPQFLQIPASEISTGPDQIIATVRERYPEWRALSMTWPRPDAPYWLTYLLRGKEAKQVYFDPKTGAILGENDPSAGWLGAVKQLHVNLLAGRIGRVINGAGAVILVFMALTGVILWWPVRRWPWQLFTGTAREMHYSAGIISAVFLFMFAVTGIYFVWPQAFIKTVHDILGTAPEIKLAPRPKNAPLLPLDVLAAKTEAVVRGRPIFRMQMVTRPDQPMRVTILEGSVAEFHRVSTVVLDPVTGDVVRLQLSRDKHVSDAFISWMSAVHFGVFGGIFVKLFWVLLGLSLPALALTGFLIWIRKQKKTAPFPVTKEVLVHR